MEDALNVIYDATTDVLRVNGMSYSGHIFRMLALADPGTWLRIEGRDNGVISVCPRCKTWSGLTLSCSTSPKATLFLAGLSILARNTIIS